LKQHQYKKINIEKYIWGIYKKMRITCIVLLAVLSISLLCVMPQTKAQNLSDMIFDIADKFKVDIRVSSPMDTNAVIYVNATKVAWVVYTDGKEIPQTTLNLLNALQKMENWTSTEILRVDDKSSDLWSKLNDTKNWTTYELININETNSNLWNSVQNTQSLTSNEIAVIENELSDINKQLQNKINELGKSNAEYDKMINLHTNTLKALYNRTLILRDIFMDFKADYILFVNETNMNISNLQENVTVLKINVSELEQNINALKHDINNLKANVNRLEADIGQLQSILLMGFGGGILVVCLFFANRRFPFGEILRNGSSKNGKQYKIPDFISRKQAKADSLAERKAHLETKHKEKEDAREGRKEKLLAKKAAKGQAKADRVAERSAQLEARYKEKEDAKQRRKVILLAKKDAKVQEKSDRVAERSAQLEARHKEKEDAREKRKEEILAKKKTYEELKVSSLNYEVANPQQTFIRRKPEKSHFRTRIRVNREKSPLQILTNKKATKKSHFQKRIRVNREKSPLRFLFQFLFFKKQF
jgi:hypothetical protein